MASLFRVQSVNVVTDVDTYSFDLSAACTVLDGPVGTGKSSLLELIKHGLGGSAVLTPVVRREVRRVDLVVDVQGGRYELRRAVGTRDSKFVSIHDVGDDKAIQTLPVRLAADRDESIGDKLLELLQFPKVRVPRSRANASSASVALTFNDLFGYVYVAQQSIDSSIVHHNEVFREPKRRALFELLFGLLNERQLELETALGQARSDLSEATARLAVVEAFMDGSQVESRETMQSRLLQFGGVAREAEEQLASLSQGISIVSNEHQVLRHRLLALEREAETAERAVDDARHELARREELVAQLELDAAREQRMASATNQLAALEFVTCPRCMQDLDDGRASVDSCFLCLQPVEHRHLVPAPLGDIDGQVSELAEALRAFGDHVQDLTREAVELRDIRDAVRSALDDVTSEAVMPRFQEIASLSSAKAEALAEQRHLRESIGLWDDLDRLKETTAQQSDSVDAIRRNIEGERRSMPDRAVVLDEVSDLLNETVQRLNLPWAERAEIDAKNYLPLINGERFDTLAVAGGMKTMVTVAYHLSLLTYALSHPECLLPSVLILDTPRKNLGFNPDDSSLGQQMYTVVRALVDNYGSSVQFIIADNDVPLGSDWYRRIHFDYDNPLIRHILHPGEEAVLSGEIKTVEGIVADPD